MLMPPQKHAKRSQQKAWVGCSCSLGNEEDSYAQDYAQQDKEFSRA